MSKESWSAQHRHRRLMPPPKSGPKLDKKNSTISIGPKFRDLNPRTSASNIFQGARAPSPTSSCNQFIDITGVPPAIARDSFRKMAYIKAQAHYARDQALDCVSKPERKLPAEERECFTQQVGCDGFGPTRKQSAFIKEEELQCRLEDRAGTAHISELQTDCEGTPPLSVEEMSMSD